MITAQDKILHVASKLGLTSLKDMQASTGAVYDVDTDLTGQLFTNSARHANPSETNVNENQFEVNEALLVETIAFYVKNTAGEVVNFQKEYGSQAVIIFDLVIGNKRVMKETPIFAVGSPYCFANTGNQVDLVGELAASSYSPRHQVYMEGVGILIPPQVQWSVQYTIFDMTTGNIITPTAAKNIGCYLFGTKVLLNFNTTI
jgi:hypothetical protein